MTRIALAAPLALSAALIASPVLATSFQTLWNFKTNLGFPWGRLQLSGSALIGTGSGDDNGTISSGGEVFKLTNSGGTWNEKTLAQFKGSDGYNPFAGLSTANGLLYGTTASGGTYSYGNVFTVFNSGGKWYHSTVWAFGYGSDGETPEGDLISDGTGNIYGTTAYGGTHGDGIAFELSYNGAEWVETVLHNFDGSDGANPVAGLVMDSSGNLYGTTQKGGTHGYGTVFELSQSGGVWSEKVLHSFSNGSDGAYPYSALILGSTGGLHGTAYQGGTYGYGVVFNLTESGGKWTEKVLHAFDPNATNGDGAYPVAALRWGSSKSILYGTTSSSTGSYGTVFKLTYSGGTWNETILHAFSGSDGSFPTSQPILDKSGNLYGTTWLGGDLSCGSGSYPGCGTAWEITP